MRSTHPSDKLNHLISANEQCFQKHMTVDQAKGVHVTIGSSTYIDLGHCNPYNTLGHSHPAVLEALRQNMYAHTVASPWEPASFPALTRSLQSLTHSPFVLSSLHNHMDSAMEEAIKTAYTFWHERREKQRKSLMCFAGSFFGNSISVSNCNKDPYQRHYYADMAPHCHTIPYPYTWINDPSAETKERMALDRLESVLKKHHDHILAFIFEPNIHTQKGMYFARTQFLNQALNMIQAHGILVIADERFLSPHRTGQTLSHHHVQFTPDIVVMGPTLTNGILPFGCTLQHPSFFDAYSKIKHPKGPLEAETPSIHPAVCALVHATLEATSSPEHQKQALQLSQMLTKKTKSLAQLPVVREVRQLGTVAAFKIANERQNSGNQTLSWFLKHCREKGILLANYGDSAVLCPPIHPSLDMESVFTEITDALERMPLQHIASSV